MHSSNSYSRYVTDSSPPALFSLTNTLSKCVPAAQCWNSCGLALSVAFMKWKLDRLARPLPAPEEPGPIVAGFETPRLKLRISSCFSNPLRVASPSIAGSNLRYASNAMGAALLWALFEHPLAWSLGAERAAVQQRAQLPRLQCDRSGCITRSPS